MKLRRWAMKTMKATLQRNPGVRQKEHSSCTWWPPYGNTAKDAVREICWYLVPGGNTAFVCIRGFVQRETPRQPVFITVSIRPSFGEPFSLILRVHASPSEVSHGLSKTVINRVLDFECSV
jgi:hypothetical protein